MRVLRFEKAKAGLDLAHVHSHFIDSIADVPQMLEDKIIARTAHSGIVSQKKIENK